MLKQSTFNEQHIIEILSEQENGVMRFGDKKISLYVGQKAQIQFKYLIGQNAIEPHSQASLRINRALG
jgi:hypothetical protein